MASSTGTITRSDGISEPEAVLNLIVNRTSCAATQKLNDRLAAHSSSPTIIHALGNGHPERNQRNDRDQR